MSKSEMANKAKVYERLGTIEGIFTVILLVSAVVFFILYAYTAAYSLAILSLGLLVLTVGAYVGLRQDHLMSELFRMH